MKKEFYIPLFCLVSNIATIIVIWFLFNNKNGNQLTVNTSVQVIKTYDSIQKQIPVPYFIPGKPIPYLIPNNVDTADIIKDYFSKYPYNRTFGDSNLTVTVIDTTYKNRISGSKFFYSWKKPQTITNIKNEIISPLKIAVFAGAFVNYTPKTITGFGPSIGVDFKQKFIVTAGYDIPKTTFNTTLIGKIGGRKK
jgi:hypothetical protein